MVGFVQLVTNFSWIRITGMWRCVVWFTVTKVSNSFTLRVWIVKENAWFWIRHTDGRNWFQATSSMQYKTTVAWNDLLETSFFNVYADSDEVRSIRDGYPSDSTPYFCTWLPSWYYSNENPQCRAFSAEFHENSLFSVIRINPLKPNDRYSGRTAPLTSKRCILYIYSTNTGTEYFKHGIYCPFFSSKCSLFHNSDVFGSCFIHIL